MGSTHRSTSSPLNPSLSTILHDFLLDIRSGEVRLTSADPSPSGRATPAPSRPPERAGGRRSPRVAGGLTPWRRPCELRPQRPPGNMLIGPRPLIHSDDDAARAREGKGLGLCQRGARFALKFVYKQTKILKKKKRKRKQIKHKPN